MKEVNRAKYHLSSDTADIEVWLVLYLDRLPKIEAHGLGD